MPAQINQKGVAPLIIVLGITALVAVAAFTTPQIKNLAQKNTPQPTVDTKLETASPSATATPSPVPTTTPSPTLKPASTATPKPAVTGATTAPDSGYAKMSVNTDKGIFNADVVVLPIGAKMVTDTADDNDCTDNCKTLSLSDFVARNAGYAGIHGSYFCPNTYPDCQSKKDSFDFPVYNSRLNKWINESKLSWDGRSIVYQDGGGIHYMQNAKDFHGGLTAGITNYPGILNGGHITVEQNSLSEKQSNRGSKGGIGFSSSKIYLVIAYNVTMGEFASVFKSLGATHALNLDGGGSSALWYGGYKVGPGRALPNAIIFK